jgi:tetratricopeptide (TPR) repeat protein
MKIARIPFSLLGLCALVQPALGQDDITEVDPTPPGASQAVPVADDEDIVILDGTTGDTGVGAVDAEDAAPLMRANPETDSTTATQATPDLAEVVGPASSQSEEEELLAQFRRFRELMDNNVIDEADIVAKRIVELAIRTDGPRSIDTARALTNLAIVQQRTEQFDAAIQNFEGAIEIIEDNTDRLDAMLINPLKGLGAAQLANGRPDQAVQTFGRAVHVTHVNEGPHNVDQIELLESLAETNLILGEVDQARDVHELIYNLNERHYRANMLDLVPSLMRRARWQHRTGYYNDERATYRRIIRILEEKKGKNDLSLIEPLIELGRSYYFIDTNDGESFAQTNPYNAEIYFKKAVRIAEESEDSTWLNEADTKLALADYFMQQQSVPSARKVYQDVWDLLSTDEERLEHRRRTLEELNPLVMGFVPEFAGDASRGDLISSNVDVREGTVSLTFDVSSRGRVSNLQVVEFSPADFPEMLRDAQRQVRSRLYRPRFSDRQPVDSDGQSFIHNFYYRVSEMEERRAAQLAND